MSLELHQEPSADAQWLCYVDQLDWKPGQLDRNCYHAALRAATLAVKDNFVLETLCERITEAGGGLRPEKIKAQIKRAFVFLGSAKEAEETAMAGQPLAAKAVRKGRGSNKVNLIRKAKQAMPPFDEMELRRIAAKIGDMDVRAIIGAHSPICVDYVTCETFLSQVYYQGEKVLLFTKYESQGQRIWCHDQKKRVPCKSRDGVWFLVNPVDGEEHPNPREGGKNSRRSQESITSFRYAVLESDIARPDDWLKMLTQLQLKITAIYESGGKSIHALFHIDAGSKAEWDSIIFPIKPHLVRLGADPAALTAVRLSRLPQAMRGNRCQRLLFLDPNPDGVPIWEKQARAVDGDWLAWANSVTRHSITAAPEHIHQCIEVLRNSSRPGAGEMVSKMQNLLGGGVQ